jgi:hypothetical protein
MIRREKSEFWKDAIITNLYGWFLLFPFLFAMLYLTGIMDTEAADRPNVEEVQQ